MRQQLIVLFSISIIIFSSCTSNQESTEKANRPNVILILTDDQGWGDLNIHGNDKLSTPVIDQMAKTGAHFERFYVSPLCAPTRASLLSRLKDRDDHVGWQEFFDTYWKLIYGVALKAGLNDSEAQDVVQETVIYVAKKLPDFRYDPEKGSFKSVLSLSW